MRFFKFKLVLVQEFVWSLVFIHYHLNLLFLTSVVALWSRISVNSLEVCWSTEELTIDSLASLLNTFLFLRDSSADFDGQDAVFVSWNLLFFGCSIFGSLLSTAWLSASICFVVGKTFLRFLLFLFGILWLNFLLMAIFSLFSFSICWISTLRGLLQKLWFLRNYIRNKH